MHDRQVSAHERSFECVNQFAREQTLAGPFGDDDLPLTKPPNPLSESQRRQIVHLPLALHLVKASVQVGTDALTISAIIP